MNRDFIKKYPTFQDHSNEEIPNTLDFSQCSLEFINYLLKAISLAPVENQNDRALKTSLQRSLSEIMPDPQGYGANASR